MAEDEFKEVTESLSENEGGAGFGMSEDLTSLYKSKTFEDIESMDDEEFYEYFSGKNGEAPSLRIDLLNDPRADALFDRMDRLGLSDTDMGDA